MSDPSEAMAVELLALRAGGRLFTLPLAAVVEVVRPLPVAELPRVPLAVLGAAQHRAEVLLVLDVALRLGLPPEASSAKSRCVVVRAARGNAGLVVAEVLGVWRDAVVQDAEVLRRGERAVLLELDGLLSWRKEWRPRALGA